MKKTVALVLAVIALLTLGSCKAARKPEQPQAKPFIVPEVSRVTYDTVDLKTAPKVVRDIARTVEKTDATAWAQTGGKAYLVISQGGKTRNYELEVDDVLQRVPEQGFTWLEARLSYIKMNNSKAAGDPVITVVRADVNSAPQGVGFTSSWPEAPGSAAGIRPQPAAPAPSPAPTPRAGAALDQPAPNQEITSPVKIQGSSTGQAQLRVRISTRGGQVIKEENLSPSPGTGKFSLEISYSPPEMPAPGEISLISPEGGDERVLARIPVIIK